MPEGSYWKSLFDVPLILRRLGIERRIGDASNRSRASLGPKQTQL
jgi:hypothetical protein